MSEITISLREPMKEYLDAQLASGKFADATEFFDYLLHEDQNRRAKEYLIKAVEGAEASGEPEEVTPESWESVRKAFREKYHQGPST
jgi:Arc/MetJ-type ribon-helix-helix transcriptional regulator